MTNTRRCIIGMLMVALVVNLSGCLTARQKAQIERQPTNRVFQAERLEPLPQGQAVSLGEYDAAGTQNLCVLQLAPDAELKERYHAEHDLTLFVAQGSAIVIVEGTRHFVTPGQAVVLPRYTAYTLKPHRTEETFIALLAYSPPFHGEDVVLSD